MWNKLSILLRSGDHFILRVFTNGGIRAVGSVFAFALSLLISRTLGAEQAGHYFYGFAAVMLLSTLIRVGTDGTIVRFTSTAHAKKDFAAIRIVFYKSAIITLIAGGVVVSLMFWGIGPLVDWLGSKSVSTDVILAIAPAVVATALLAIIAMSLQGMHHVSASVVVLTIGTNLLMVCTVLLSDIQSAVTLANALSIMSSGTVALAMLYWLYVTPRAQQGSKHAAITWAAIFASCLPLWSIAILTQMITWSGQLIAGQFVSAAELAHLAVAQRISALISFTLVAVSAVVTPRFAALHSQDKLPELAALVYRSIKLLTLISIPLVVFCLIFAEHILRVFGDDFVGGATIFRILVLAQLFNAITGPMNFLLVMAGHEKQYQKIVYVLGPMFLLIAFTLIPLFGAIGAACALGISGIALNLTLAYRVNSLLKINILNTFNLKR